MNNTAYSPPVSRRTERAARFTDAQIADARRADILTIVPGLSKWSRTSGGEYAGPCPLCGGANRFHAWPYHPKGGRAFCRQCHPDTMNPIDLVIWLGKAPDFAAAVAWLIGDTRPRLILAAPDPEPAAPQPYRPPPAWQRVTARYNYYIFTPGQTDHPILHWQKERREPGPQGKRKTFYARRPRPGLDHPPHNECPADWYAGRGDIPLEDLMPYNWPAALAAPPGVPLLWVDGEKDVGTGRAAGLIAVCGPDGGDSWQEPWGILFYEHPALIIPDGTPEGPAQAERAARLLAAYADSVKIVPLAPHKDFTAWCEARRQEGASYVA